jgi:type I restriction enzyme S subunit
MSFLRYPEYRKSEVTSLGEIPTHWTTRRIRSITSIQKGRLPRSTNEQPSQESDLPYLTMEYLRGEESISSMFISIKDQNIIANEGDILLLWDGSNAGEFLKAKKGVVSSTLAIIKNFSIEKNYLFYGLKSIEKYLKDQTIGMGIPHVSGDILRNLIIYLPSETEQKQIVKFLDHETFKIESLITEQEKLIKLLTEKRQAVISHSVTKGLDPNIKMKDSGIEWLGEIPEHWNFGTLARVANRVVVGIAEAATHAYSHSGTPILRATNIRPGRITGEILYVNSDFSDERDTKMLKTRDLVTVRTGNAGVTAVIPPELDSCQCFTMLITTLNSSSNPEFYCYWANSIAAQQYFSLEGWGTAQINISVPILKSLPSPIPSLEEQLKIVRYLDKEIGSIDTLIETSNTVINLLRERRIALISAAVTGQIDVRNYQIKEAA